MKYLLMFLLFQFHFSFSIIKIPLELIKSEEKNYNFEKDTLYLNFSTNFEIGNPKQIIKSRITMNEYSFYIFENKSYNSLLSKTYKKIKEEELNIKYEDYSSGIFSSDNIILFDNKEKKINLENFKFMLATKNVFDKEIKSMIIGFKNMDLFKTKERNFIYELKNLNIINSYVFTIKFQENNKGEILIGKNPDEYDSNYLSKNFIYTKVETDAYQKYWQFTFDNIYSDKDEIDNNILIKFSFDYGVIISNKYYNNFIQSKFFSVYIKNGICQLNYTNNKELFYYSCFDDVNITNFPQLKFYNKILNFTFQFDYKDLFIKVNNKYYFLIVFQLNGLKWILGTPFMKKFQMVFDQDREIIGFYTSINDKKFFGFFQILSLFFLFIIIILSFLYFRLLFKKTKKIRANELDENFDYTPHLLQ